MFYLNPELIACQGGDFLQNVLSRGHGGPRSDLVDDDFFPHRAHAF